MAGEEFPRCIRHLGQLPSDLPHVCPTRCGNAFLWNSEGVWLPSHGLGIPVLDRINRDLFGCVPLSIDVRSFIIIIPLYGPFPNPGPNMRARPHPIATAALDPEAPSSSFTSPIPD